MRGLSNIFRKTSEGVGNIFRKAGEAGENVFRKVSDVAERIKEQGPAIAERISRGAGEAQNILGKVSDISGQIARNPIVQTLPFGSQVAMGAGLISNAARLGAKGAGQISQLSNLKNYSTEADIGKQLENIRDARRRAEEIQQTGRELGSVFM